MQSGIDIALLAARIADEKKGRDIVVYDLRGISDVSDFFVVATALSKLQIGAISSEIERTLKGMQVFALGIEGSSGSQWMLLDYADTVIHLFSPELREYYSLESLWGDAPRVEWNNQSAPARPKIV